MKTLSVKTIVAASPDEVVRDLWHLERLQTIWNLITDHYVTYDDGMNQECLLWVDWHGCKEPLRVIRFRQDADIVFFNPVPLPMMSFHRGVWQIRPIESNQCEIIAKREYGLIARPDHSEAEVKAWNQCFHNSFEKRLATLLQSFKTYYATLCQSPSLEVF